MLIAARVVQGVGAGVLTPQTLSTITRIFPPERRGAAMSVWGATAGVASLVGPLAGGVLVDSLGWEWIFFVNIPLGVIGLALAVWLVPALPTQAHRFDLPGVALSGAGVFAIVFGLQQGQSAGWAPWIWAVIVAGIGLMAAFVYWQSINPGEPLIPLDIFGDRNFSLCNVGAAIIAFATTAMMLPTMFYAQAVCGLSPTRSALLFAPLAIANGAFAPFVGRLIDRFPPLPVLGFGFSTLAIGLTWLSFEMAPGTPIWRLALAFFVIGVGMAFVWAPLTATATRNLPPDLAGASSGVYNTTRQLGAVLGSAGMAAFMTSRISAEMPRGGRNPTGAGMPTMPAFLREPFSAALSQSILLPAFVALLGVIAALFLVDVIGAATTCEDGVAEPTARQMTAITTMTTTSSTYFVANPTSRRGEPVPRTTALRPHRYAQGAKLAPTGRTRNLLRVPAPRRTDSTGVSCNTIGTTALTPRPHNGTAFLLVHLGDELVKPAAICRTSGYGAVEVRLAGAKCRLVPKTSPAV